jgi:hypothetical protein
VIEQVDDTQFRVLVPFMYIDRTGNEHEVPASDPNDPSDVTDLASVPWILRWLVASYGQHTTAALLHDRLVRPGMTLPEGVETDPVFFRALEESGKTKREKHGLSPQIDESLDRALQARGRRFKPGK